MQFLFFFERYVMGTFWYQHTAATTCCVSNIKNVSAKYVIAKENQDAWMCSDLAECDVEQFGA